MFIERIKMDKNVVIFSLATKLEAHMLHKRNQTISMCVRECEIQGRSDIESYRSVTSLRVNECTFYGCY